MDGVEDERVSDMDGVRRQLFLSVCDSILQFRRSISSSDEERRFLIFSSSTNTSREEMKYPSTARQIFATIESLLRLPLDLLSMKMNLGEVSKNNKNSFQNINEIFLGFGERSIMGLAVEFSVVDVIELILDIDPEQAKDSCQPFHQIMRTTCGNDLRLVKRLYDLNPDAIRQPNMEIESQDLPLHSAVGTCKSMKVIKFLVRKYPQAMKIQNKEKELPMNKGAYFHNNIDEIHKFMIQSYPEGLKNRLKNDSISGFHMHQWFVMLNDGDEDGINHMIRKSYHYGIKYGIFGKDTVYGLFEIVKFGGFALFQLYDEEVIDQHESEYIEMWQDYFGVEYLYDEDEEDSCVVERTTLELFLCRYRELGEDNYIRGWNDARYVFEAALEFDILQPAIGRVQDDFLPYIIDKFDVDLLKPDEDGRTPLIVSMYHTVFIADVNDDDGNNDNGDDAGNDEIPNSNKRKYSYSSEELLLSYASMILSSGKSSYQRRRPDQPLKCNIISMMLRNHDTTDMDSGDDSSPTCKNENSNSAMISDANDRLPLYIGAEIGLKWDNGLKTILDAYSLAVKDPDPMSGLFPFMLAAVGNESDLDTVFELFVTQPDVIE